MSQKVKVKNGFFEHLSQEFITEFKKKIFEPKIVGFRFSQLLTKLREAAKPYVIEKEKLIDQYAVRGEKGVIVGPNGEVMLTDPLSFNRELKAIQDIDVDIDIDMVEINLDELVVQIRDEKSNQIIESSLSIDEFEFITPFAEIK